MHRHSIAPISERNNKLLNITNTATSSDIILLLSVGTRCILFPYVGAPSRWQRSTAHVSIVVHAAACLCVALAPPHSVAFSVKFRKLEQLFSTAQAGRQWQTTRSSVYTVYNTCDPRIYRGADEHEISFAFYQSAKCFEV